MASGIFVSGFFLGGFIGPTLGGFINSVLNDSHYALKYC